MLSTPAPDKRDVIDLKNCKRREPKKARVREFSFAAGGIGLLLIAGIFMWWSAHASLDLAIASARTTEKTQKELTEAAKKMIKQRDDVDNFLNGAANWLDEIDYLAAKVPPAEEVMLSEPNFELLGDSVKRIQVMVSAKDLQSIDRLEVESADSQHSVKGSGKKELDQKKGEYGYTAKEVIVVSGRGWDTSPSPTKPPAPTK